MRVAWRVGCLAGVTACLLSWIGGAAGEGSGGKGFPGPEAAQPSEQRTFSPDVLFALPKQPGPTLAFTGRAFPLFLGRDYGALWADLPLGCVGSVGYRFVEMDQGDIEEVYLGATLCAKRVKREYKVSLERMRVMVELLEQQAPSEGRERAVEEARERGLADIYTGKVVRHLEYVEFGGVRAEGGEWLVAVGFRLEDEDLPYLRFGDESGVQREVDETEVMLMRSRNINRLLIMFDSERPVVEFQHRWLGWHWNFEWGISFSGARPLRRGYYQGFGYSVRY